MESEHSRAKLNLSHQKDEMFICRFGLLMTALNGKLCPLRRALLGCILNSRYLAERKQPCIFQRLV